MANPSEAQALPVVGSANTGYITVDLHARSDDGKQKQAAVHWFSQDPRREEIAPGLKGAWMIDLTAFQLLAEVIAQQWPSQEVAETIERLERELHSMKTVADQRARDFEKAEAVRVGREEVYERFVRQLVQSVRGEGYLD